MTDQSTNLQLPYLMPSQAQKHVTVNEAVRRLDALVQTAVESRAVDAQPGSPADGAVWILPPGKTGPEWGLYADWALAYYRDGSWEQLHPKSGWRVFVRDEASTLVYDGADWIADLSAPGEIGDAAPAPATFTRLNGGPLAGLRNALINGAFDIWARGASFSADAYTADRWRVRFSGASGTLTRQLFSPGDTLVDGVHSEPAPRYFARLAVTSANDDARLEQPIENAWSFAGQEITFSAWVRCDTATTIRLEVSRNYGSGGSTQESLDANDVAVAADQWTRATLTVSMPSLSGKTVGAGSFLLAAVSNPNSETFELDIALAQFEPGPVATPFEARPIALETAMCRRFFERLAGDGINLQVGAFGFAETASQGRSSLSYAAKRVAPTVSCSSASHFAFMRSGSTDTLTSSISTADISRTACRVTGSYSAATLTVREALILRTAHADAAIDIDAEF